MSSHEVGPTKIGLGNDGAFDGGYWQGGMTVSTDSAETAISDVETTHNTQVSTGVACVEHVLGKRTSLPADCPFNNAKNVKDHTACPVYGRAKLEAVLAEDELNRLTNGN